MNKELLLFTYKIKATDERFGSERVEYRFIQTNSNSDEIFWFEEIIGDRDNRKGKSVPPIIQFRTITK